MRCCKEFKTFYTFSTQRGFCHVKSYAYDSMGRLTGETLDGETACYSYDHAGNRLTRTGAGRTEHYCYNSRNQLTGLDLTAQPAPSVMNMILQAAALRQRYIPRRAEALQSVPVTRMMRITGTHPYAVQVMCSRTIYDAEGLRYAVTENGETTNFVYRNGMHVSELERIRTRSGDMYWEMSISVRVTEPRLVIT